jgi:hypothetical protein
MAMSTLYNNNWGLDLRAIITHVFLEEAHVLEAAMGMLFVKMELTMLNENTN